MPLVVVADGKATLVGEAQVGREITDPLDNFTDETLQIHSPTRIFQFGDVASVDTQIRP